MRDPKQELLRFHYGDESLPIDTSQLNDIEILRNDIDRLDKKFDQVTQVLVELTAEIKKLNTL